MVIVGGWFIFAVPTLESPSKILMILGGSLMDWKPPWTGNGIWSAKAMAWTAKPSLVERHVFPHDAHLGDALCWHKMHKMFRWKWICLQILQRLKWIDMDSNRWTCQTHFKIQFEWCFFPQHRASGCRAAIAWHHLRIRSDMPQVIMTADHQVISSRLEVLSWATWLFPFTWGYPQSSSIYYIL